MDFFEVLVVDQASTDGSRDMVRDFDAGFNIRLIEQDDKYGISVSRNGGINLANNPLIILLDADIVADHQLVEAHYQLHQSNHSCLGCGAILPYLPAYQSFIDHVSNPEAGLNRDPNRDEYPFYWAFGGHLSFTKDTFNSVGAFKPELKGFEDIEFAYRAVRNGCIIINCEKAVGYHNHPRSLNERSIQAFTYSQMMPVLLNMHPELKGKIPGILEFEDINFKKDSALIIKKKVNSLFWSAPVNLYFLNLLLHFLDRYRILPRFTKAAYYRLILGKSRTGYKQGEKSMHQL